jgi:signal peptidase I
MDEKPVPEGNYFVMGDNRVPLGSSDSRHFGTIPRHYVRGRALLVIFPWQRDQVRNIRVLASPQYAND